MPLLQKTRELQEPLYSFFWGDEPRFLCEDICFLYGIPEEKIGDVSFFVAPLLTKMLPLSNLQKELQVKFPDLLEGVTFGLAYEINKRIVYKFPEEFPEALPLLSEWEKKKSKSTLSEEEAHKKTLAAESWYLDWKRQNEQVQVSEAVTKESQTVSLPLLDAMAKYQRLSEQSITEDRITVKGESQPVRGSLRNWVRHYRDALGIRKHSAMERGQFLFQGENTKRLEAADREKLSLLFRSLDENVPVSIDVERQEVIFPAFEEKATPSPVSGVSEQQKESTTPSLGTSFRPLEKFPVQTAPIHKALEWDRKAPPQNSSQPDLQVPPAVSSVETPSLELTKKPGLSVGISAPAYDFGALQKMSPSEPSSEPRVASPAMPPLPKSPVESPSPPFASGGKMSFSSSHILPSEKQSLKEKGDSGVLKPEASTRDLAPKTLEAVGIIRPRGEGFGFRPLPSGSRSSDDKNSFDAPRVVNFGGGK